MPDALTLAQRIKAKHPEYGDLPDAELETRVLAKHPEYGDLPRTTSSDAKPIDQAEALDTAMGAIGRAGLAGMPGGDIGAAVARFVGNPKHAPTITAGMAGLLTGGASLPVSAAITAGAGGVGSIAKNAADYFLGHGKASLGEAATDVAKDAAMQGGAQLAGGLVGKGLEAAAPKVMAAVLKPSQALRRNNPGMDIPLEAVKQGAVVSKGGLAAQGERVGGLNQAVDAAVQGSNATVQPSRAAASLGDLLRERQALGPVGAGDAQKIQDALVSFVGKDQPMPVTQAQEIKKFLGSKLANKFGSLGADPVTVDIQQALRAGTKHEIANAIPDVASLNEQLAPAIAVRKALAQRLGTTENTNVIPARVFMAHNPILAGLSALTGAPAVASRAAGTMYRAAPAAGQLAPQAIRAALLGLMDNDSGDQP
jgi:hypothetical protein